jgi:hypothetical protein
MKKSNDVQFTKEDIQKILDSRPYRCPKCGSNIQIWSCDCDGGDVYD